MNDIFYRWDLADGRRVLIREANKYFDPPEAYQLGYLARERSAPPNCRWTTLKADSEVERLRAWVVAFYHIQDSGDASTPDEQLYLLANLGI